MFKEVDIHYFIDQCVRQSFMARQWVCCNDVVDVHLNWLGNEYVVGIIMYMFE